MHCLDDNVISAFVAGRLPAATAEAIQHHVDACAACRELVVGVLHAQSMGDEGSTLAGSPGPATAGTGRLIAPGTTVGRYFVLELVGAGGMGQVYSAYDPQLDRKVALKCLKADALGASAAESQARLLREAQAMAKLSHPNVVPVFDVGIFEEQIFLTMAFVQGQTLREWVRGAERPWAETVRMLVASGRGLAAAHAAGLVHRDFKPANVLVGEDGRVQVTDFGLARVTEAPMEASDELLPPSPASAFDALTRPGSVPGTPAYTAPERHDGVPADARADQFSFCVTLYEALYGERPHPGTTYVELVSAIRSGTIRAAPEGSRVPGWLRQRVLRGLDVDPQRRYPSMEALLEALGTEAPRRRVWRWLGAAAAVTLLALSSGYALTARRAAMCKGAEARLTGVWDETRRSGLKDVFAATGKPWSAAAWARVGPALDEWAQAWMAGHKDACEAAQLRGDQSEHIMDLRMACLERRRRELQALTHLISAGDEAVLAQAPEAVFSLPPVSACEDVEALLAEVPPPDDPDARAKVEALRGKLADAQALFDSGKYQDALRAVEAVLPSARALEYGPLVAEVLLLQGYVQERTGDYKAAESTLKEAAHAAEAARHDEVAASAWSELVLVTGARLMRRDAAVQWQKVAAAAVARVGRTDEALGARLENNVGWMLKEAGDYPGALAHLQKGLEIRERVLGTDHPLVAESIQSVSVALVDLQRKDEALEANHRAIAMREKLFGADHPSFAHSLFLLGGVYIDLRRFQEAEAAIERAIGIARGALGPSSAVLANYVNNLGIVLQHQERFAEAEANYTEALQIRTAVLGPDHPHVGGSHGNLGVLASLRGDPDRALVHFQKASDIFIRALGPDHPRVTMTLLNIAETHRGEREFEQAADAFRRALPGAEAKHGPKHPLVVAAVMGLGLSLESAARPRDALPYLRRASSMAAEELLTPAEHAEVDFALAKATVATGGSRKNAVRLATEARRRADGATDPQLLRARIDAWLRHQRAL